MRYIYLFSFLVFTFSCKSVKPLTSDIIKEKITLEETKTIIGDLSKDELAGRKPGTKGYDSAVDYVVSYFKKNKIEPFFTSYLDNVTIGGRVSYNVLGFVGERKGNRGNILLGAHLDHIGVSASGGIDTIFNGANDDASGVTAVMQIAKVLQGQKLDQNIIVALFTEEESGLNGSKALAQKLKSQDVKIDYMVNFEMLGTTLSTGPNKVYISGYKLSDMAQNFNAAVGFDFIEYLPAETQYKLFYRSDNYSFYNIFKVPAQTLSTFDFQNYDYYHKVDDEVEFLNMENLNSVIRTSAFGIYNMIKNGVKHNMRDIDN